MWIMSDKLGAMSDKCLSMGNPHKNNGYYFYNLLEQKMFVSRHAVVLQTVFILERGNGSTWLLFSHAFYSFFRFFLLSFIFYARLFSSFFFFCNYARLFFFNDFPTGISKKDSRTHRKKTLQETTLNTQNSPRNLVCGLICLRASLLDSFFTQELQENKKNNQEYNTTQLTLEFLIGNNQEQL